MSIEIDIKRIATQAATENLLTYSENFNHANWEKFNTPIFTENSAIAPDGTLSMYNVEDDSAVVHEYFSQTFPSFSVDTLYNLSLHVKKDEVPRTSRFVVLRMFLGGSIPEVTEIRFDTSTGEFFQYGSVSVEDVGVVDLGDYWRIYISSKSYNLNNTYGSLFFFIAGGASDSWVYATSAIGACDIWGAQLSEGSDLLDYVKTEANVVTRQSSSGVNKSNIFKSNIEIGTKD